MNNGVMIATNRLASIIESFQTSDSDKETSELGWGLCLSICDWLAGMHAGHHAVESEVGGVARVSVFVADADGPPLA